MRHPYHFLRHATQPRAHRHPLAHWRQVRLFRSLDFINGVWNFEINQLTRLMVALNVRGF